MIYFSRILLLALVFFISSCSVDEPTGLSDAEIVQMIIEAEKAEITIDELKTPRTLKIQFMMITLIIWGCMLKKPLDLDWCRLSRS